MTEEDIIRRNYEHFSSQFPKTCHACGRSYATLRDYVLTTSPDGPLIPYDLELREWQPTDPIGTMALAKCACGSTMAVTTQGQPLSQIQETLDWMRLESKKRGVSVRQIFAEVRSKIRERAMAEPIDEPGE